MSKPSYSINRVIGVIIIKEEKEKQTNHKQKRADIP